MMDRVALHDMADKISHLSGENRDYILCPDIATFIGDWEYTRKGKDRKNWWYAPESKHGRHYAPDYLGDVREVLKLASYALPLGNRIVKIQVHDMMINVFIGRASTYRGDGAVAKAVLECLLLELANCQ